jgi:hypothetical protein
MMRAHNVLLTAALFAGVTAVKADVAITQQVEGKASLVKLDGEGSIKIKGNQQRGEQLVKGKPVVVITDIDGRRFITLDDKKKSATITPLQSLGERLQKATAKPVQVSVVKTAEEKTIASYPCTVHQVKLSWPVNIGGPEIAILASGTACLSTAVPGYAEYRAFYNAASNAGFVFGDPKLAKTTAGAAQANAFAVLTRKMAEAGVTLESHIVTVPLVDGATAALLGGVANADVRTLVTKIDAADLPAELFAVPTGYEVKTQK